MNNRAIRYLARKKRVKVFTKLFDKGTANFFELQLPSLKNLQKIHNDFNEHLKTKIKWKSQ